MPDRYLFFAVYGLVLLTPVSMYIRRQIKRDRKVKEARAKGELFSEGPRGQHPQIDVSNCIGCQSCASVCPEGSVIGMVGGKAALINPHKCIGHGLCADACPVGAIKLVTATPGLSASLPYLTEDLETSVPNLFIAGELGGLALIKNAVRQGSECIEAIARRLATDERNGNEAGFYDVVIVGAGPAGISASLKAIEQKLNYVTLERETLGGSVAKYPRQKMVLTSPIQFPLSGALKKMQVSKESLLEFWKALCGRDDFNVRLNEPVEHISRDEDGIFTVKTPQSEYRSFAVVLAMGRSGTPRKLGVKGEDLPKVMYRLIEADHYRNHDILVVGGGDSAVEAAVALTATAARVTLSYRKESFGRIKERNAQRLESATRSGALTVILNSMPVEFTETSAILDVQGAQQEIPNEFVWIFAGGVAPNEFLKKVGVEFGSLDLTLQAAKEAAQTVKTA